MTASSPSFFSLARRSFWLLFGGIWLLAGVFMLVFGVAFALREQSFASGGVVTTGIVLEKQIVPADSDSSTQYRVRYRFTATGGSVVEGTDDVDLNAWEALVERGPIEIRYLTDEPETNRVGSGGDFFGAVIFLVAGIALSLIGGVLFFRAIGGIRKARRLLAVGVSADATISEVVETNVTYNRRQQFKVRYSYVDERGATHTGESGYMPFEEASLWNPGDIARIRYDPDRPDESHWLGAPEPAPQAPPRVVDAPPPIDAPPPAG